EILELRSQSNSFIPKQRAFESHVLLEVKDELSKAGNYKVLNDEESITTLSFNHSREENKSNYFTATELGNNNIAYSVEDLVYKLNEEDGILNLWKYFVIGALFFLICELLILKFLK
ncbi:alpha-1-antitrypsin, partial [Nonlabens mediterrranea]|nr:alpha-1-antitrypsin [Nonlabens mediterrranea]